MVECQDKYFGLPSIVGRSKREIFNSIRQRVRGMMQGWQEKLLSKVSIEIFIKAVMQAVPTYAMPWFKLPKFMCTELSSMMINFLWGQKSNEWKTHWIAWDKLCLPKNKGGMGFRNLEAFD